MPTKNTLLTGIVGSRAYGLAQSDSDTDRMSVHLQPTQDFLGLNPPNLSSLTHSQTGTDDSTSHDLGKYLSLVLACNPTVSELLWLDTDFYETMTPHGQRLIEMRESFLFAKGVRNAYLGYTHAQAHRCNRDFINEKRREKAARHTYRLMHCGTQLWLTGQLPVMLDKATQASCLEFGREIANADMEGRRKLTDKLIAETERQFAKATPLPSDNHQARIEADAWLRTVRIQHLQQTAVI